MRNPSGKKNTLKQKKLQCFVCKRTSNNKKLMEEERKQWIKKAIKNIWLLRNRMRPKLPFYKVIYKVDIAIKKKDTDGKLIGLDGT